MPTKAPRSGSQEASETLAIQALAFIAEDGAHLAGFLNATGIEPGAIRAAARDRDFLAGVLDYVLGDEPLLLAFADSAGIDPAEVARRRANFGHHWERDLP